MAVDKKRASKLNLTLHETDLEKDCEELFLTLLRQKYSIPEFRSLLNTDKHLVEFSRLAHKREEYWTGCVKEEDGSNVLYSKNTMGNYIMRIRDE